MTAPLTAAVGADRGGYYSYDLSISRDYLPECMAMPSSRIIVTLFLEDDSYEALAMLNAAMSYHDGSPWAFDISMRTDRLQEVYARLYAPSRTLLPSLPDLVNSPVPLSQQLNSLRRTSDTKGVSPSSMAKTNDQIGSPSMKSLGIQKAKAKNTPRAMAHRHPDSDFRQAAHLWSSGALPSTAQPVCEARPTRSCLLSGSTLTREGHGYSAGETAGAITTRVSTASVGEHTTWMSPYDGQAIIYGAPERLEPANCYVEASGGRFSDIMN
ncbi:hypothetical protein DFP72DRAFT_1083230 [Ephemerocybe angulata]|nr:hypothetical protein DFP72DRAFT_1083230 [Tulosesus angulatus]